MDLKELARVLNITEDEAREVQQTDKRIDRGEKLFELPPELEAGAKKARRADRKKVENVKREKKVDNDKLYLMKVFEYAIKDDDNCDSFEIVNPEREMIFFYNGKKYKLTLACPRS